MLGNDQCQAGGIGTGVNLMVSDKDMTKALRAQKRHNILARLVLTISNSNLHLSGR